MELLKLVKERKNAATRQVISVSIKKETIEQIDKFAKQAGVSVSYLAGEILDMGLAVGQSIEVFGQQVEGFVERLLVANPMLKNAQKKTNKKPVRRITKKPVKFGGRR